MELTVDTQQRILDSARDLIFSRSYAEVGMAAICEHAGVRRVAFIISILVSKRSQLRY
ncbi:MAG: hypothetical protein B7Y50_09985 [Hydrogenophilales bacterium 28-61-11]|nr:MAG: hypothetical protein B7Y50_09985 [Hydrogenophilales bacterium 28-61-11]OYZ57526.1 MAG: hypothetical protein B7Y21_07365 [Hydrogenophilales bacterium 16-61-112]